MFFALRTGQNLGGCSLPEDPCSPPGVRNEEVWHFYATSPTAKKADEQLTVALLESETLARESKELSELGDPCTLVRQSKKRTNE